MRLGRAKPKRELADYHKVADAVQARREARRKKPVQFANADQIRQDARAYAPEARLRETAGQVEQLHRDCEGMPRNWEQELPQERPAWCCVAERTMLWCLEWILYVTGLWLLYATAAPSFAVSSVIALTVVFLGALGTYQTNRRYSIFALVMAAAQAALLAITLVIRLREA